MVFANLTEYASWEAFLKDEEKYFTAIFAQKDDYATAVRLADTETLVHILYSPNTEYDLNDRSVFNGFVFVTVASKDGKVNGFRTRLSKCDGQVKLFIPKFDKDLTDALNAIR